MFEVKHAPKLHFFGNEHETPQITFTPDVKDSFLKPQETR